MPPLLWRIAEFKAKNLGVGPQIGGFTPLPGVYLRVFGVTKNSSGVAIGYCAVHLFRTSDDVEVDQVISDASGNYEFRSASLATTYYVVAYKTAGFRAAKLAINPAGYWRLGEASGTVAADQMAANPGTYVNAPTLGVASLLTGDADTAVKFNGTTQQVTIPDSDAFSIGTTGALSVSVWVKPTASAAATKVLIGKNAGAASYEWQLYRYDRAAYIQARDLGGGTLFYIEALSVLTDGVIANIVGVFRQNGLCELYVNGLLVGGPTAMGGSTTSGTAAVTIAQRGDGADFSDDTIDEPAIWSRAVSPGEIAALYAAGTTVTTDLAGTTVNTLVGS